MQHKFILLSYLEIISIANEPTSAAAAIRARLSALAFTSPSTLPSLFRMSLCLPLLSNVSERACLYCKNVKGAFIRSVDETIQTSFLSSIFFFFSTFQSVESEVRETGSKHLL